MSSIFGTIIPASNVEKILREESYWKNQYDTLNKASQDINTQLSAAVRGANFDFSKNAAIMQRVLSKDILQAYDESFDQKSAILSSNLGQGYKEDLIGDLDSALNSAYESYLLNYQQDKLANERQLNDTIAAYEQNAAKAQAQVDAQREMLDEAINKEANYQSEFYSSIPEYLDWLYKQVDEGNLELDLYNMDSWRQYTNDEGEYLGSASIREQMYTPLQYDNDGNIMSAPTLTKYGVDVYNQLLSEMSQRGYTDFSYDKYLSENNKELYKWLGSSNAYDETLNNLSYSLKQIGVNELNWKVLNDISGATTADELVRYVNDSGTTSRLEVDKDGNLNVYRGKNFGTIKVYGLDGNNDTIIAYDDLEIVGNVRDASGDNFSAQYTDDSGTLRKYNFEIAPEDDSSRLTSDDSVYKSINRNVGGIKAGKIYSYGNDSLYVAVESDGEIVLRKLQGQGKQSESSTYSIFLRTMRNTSEWGNNIAWQHIQAGKNIYDKSLPYKDWLKRKRAMENSQNENTSNIKTSSSGDTNSQRTMQYGTSWKSYK